MRLLRRIWHEWHVFKYHLPRRMAELSFFFRYVLRTQPSTAGGYPIPGPGLVYLVAGTRDIYWFLEAGQRGATAIVDTLESQGIDLTALTSVLDFGCGCGRVMRHMPELWPSATSLYGTDYNKKLVKWCQRNLTFAEFNTNDLKPPLDYGSDAFDLVYALSVFTHLDYEAQFEWFAELDRVIRPGGYLYLTTRTENELEQLTPEELEVFERGELVVHNPQRRGKNSCNAFHPQKFVREDLAARYGFEVIFYEGQGARGNPPQDAFLLRKKMI